MQIQPSVKTCEGSEPFPAYELTFQPAQTMCVHGDEDGLSLSTSTATSSSDHPQTPTPISNSKGTFTLQLLLVQENSDLGNVKGV